MKIANKKLLFRWIELLIVIPFFSGVVCFIANKFINVVANKADQIALLYDYKKNNSPIDNVIIINIEEDSRENTLETLKRVKACDPLVIGLDEIFSEREDVKIDSILAKEILETSNIVLPIDIKDNLKPFFYNKDLGLKVGSANFYENIYVRDYKVKDYYDNKEIPSFGAAVVSTFKPIKFTNEKYSIDFSRKIHSINSNYIDNNINFIKDKIVLIGSKSIEEDQHQTPIGIKSGIEVNAYIINTIIANNNISFISFVKILLLWILIYALYMGLYISIKKLSNKYTKIWSSWILSVFVILQTLGAFFIMYRMEQNYILEYSLLVPASVSLVVAFYSTIIESVNEIRNNTGINYYSITVSKD